MRRPSGRMVVFGLGVLVVVVAVTVYLVLVVRDRAQDRARAAADEQGREYLAPADVLAGPHLVVRNTAPGPSYGRVALVPLDDPDGPRALLDPACDRVHAVATAAVCLRPADGSSAGVLTAYETVLATGVTADGLAGTTVLPLAGTPSRTQLSASGAHAATTSFVTGHSYNVAGFSTETVIVDVAAGTSLGNLESWTTTALDGSVVDAVDRNYWAVTFAPDGTTFYATLAYGASTYLVRGDIPSRTMTVLLDNAVCPAVSPDGERLVFKQRTDAFPEGRLVVYDVASGAVTPLAESRFVDDQPVWLDDATIAYGLARQLGAEPAYDVWTVAADGSGTPTVLVPDAASPSLVRP